MEKIVKTDFKEYDYLTKYEEIIQNNPNFLEYSVMQKNAKTPKEKKLYLLAILTILYKEQAYKSYYDSLSKKFGFNNSKKEIEYELFERITEELKWANFKNIYIELLQNKNRITKYINEYFERKKQNYIVSRKTIERIQKISKKTIKLNPLIINQLINYQQNPLTQEEKIIGDLIDFLRVANMITNKDNIMSLEIIKALMILNYEEKELMDAITFIIYNVYQETKLNIEDPIRELMEHLIENDEEISTEEIVETFLKEDEFSKIILSTFLSYNMNIKEGRLDELKNHPSYEILKKRIQK